MSKFLSVLLLGYFMSGMSHVSGIQSAHGLVSSFTSFPAPAGIYPGRLTTRLIYKDSLPFPESETRSLSVEDSFQRSYRSVDGNLPIADPFILFYNGKYYAYGTRVQGFEVYISEDLKHWKKGEHLALSPKDSWGAKWYWAPEVYYIPSKEKFYMFYTVDEHICIATSSSPVGPFVQANKKPVLSEEKGIDPTLFIDSDGTAYLYFVRFTDGNVIWMAEMNDDLSGIKTNTLTKCIWAEDQWEKIQGKVAEGPSVLRHGDMYYLMYSANHFRSKDYGVGYATANSPKGPWKKYPGNPILRRDRPAASGLVGTGHGAPFLGADRTYKYVYHAHANENAVEPRSSYISDLVISEQGVLEIKGLTIKPQLKK